MQAKENIKNIVKILLISLVFGIFTNLSFADAPKKSKLSALKKQSAFLGVWKTNQGQLIISQFGKWVTASLEDLDLIGMQSLYSKKYLTLKYFSKRTMKMRKVVLKLSKNRTTFTAKLNRKIWIGSRIKKAHADFMLSAAKFDFNGEWRTKLGIFKIKQKNDLIEGRLGRNKISGKIQSGKAFIKLKRRGKKTKKAILELIGNGPWITVRLVEAKRMFLGVKLPK